MYGYCFPTKNEVMPLLNWLLLVKENWNKLTEWKVILGAMEIPSLNDF